MRWAVGSDSTEGGLTVAILAAVRPSFFVPVRMHEEAANDVNTGICGRFMACDWGCVGYDKGRGKEWGLNGVGKAWKRRWKMTEMEALAEADASFFVVCRMGKKRRFLS